MKDITKEIKVLLIEDDSDDSLLAKETLDEICIPKFQVLAAEQFQEGLKILENEYIDVLLLDLSVPDGHGLEMLSTIKETYPHLPIVALTGLNDDTIAFKTIAAGAQDYVVKGFYDRNSLSKAVRYAIERQRINQEFEHEILHDYYAREIEFFRQLVTRKFPDLTYKTLKKTNPLAYEELRQEYSELLDLIVLQPETLEAFLNEHEPDDQDAKRFHELKHSRIHEKDIASIAAGFGRVDATSLDIVEVHYDVLKSRMENSEPNHMRAFITEGRKLLIELMGCLISHYRKYCVEALKC